MSHLFSPFKIKDITLKNRIVISPMCQYSSVDGFANDWHLVHLGSRAVGGAALIIQEATAVSPEGRISPDDMGIWKDEHIEKLRQITDFIHSQNSFAGIQLAHAGRKASFPAPWKGKHQIKLADGGWQGVAPSPVPYYENDEPPMELTIESIQNVILDFKRAAERALKAGYKVIEIHAAHGYLIHEFLSPMSNFRQDEYGGSFENRIRLLLEIIEKVQEVWPENLPLFVRISATDWVENGWNENDSARLGKVLLEKGVDLVDASSGANVAAVKIPLKPGYQVPFAEKIRKESGIATGAVGLITSAKQAEEILSEGKADLIFIARASLRDAYFPQNAAQELGEDFEWKKQYERGKL